MKGGVHEGKLHADESSLNRYKGAFFDIKVPQVCMDPITGAHFRYPDMCARLEALRRLAPSSEEIADPEEADVAEECVGPDPMLPYRDSEKGIKLLTTLRAKTETCAPRTPWTRESFNPGRLEMPGRYLSARKQSAMQITGKEAFISGKYNLKTESSCRHMEAVVWGNGQTSVSSTSVVPPPLWSRRSYADEETKNHDIGIVQKDSPRYVSMKLLPVPAPSWLSSKGNSMVTKASLVDTEGTHSRVIDSTASCVHEDNGDCQKGDGRKWSIAVSEQIV